MGTSRRARQLSTGGKRRRVVRHRTGQSRRTVKAVTTFKRKKPKRLKRTRKTIQTRWAKNWFTHDKARFTIALIIWVAGVLIVIAPKGTWVPSWLLWSQSGQIMVLALLFASILVIVALRLIWSQEWRDKILGVGDARTGSHQKIIGAIVVVLTALVAVFGVLRTVEQSAVSSQLDEKAALNERFERAAQMLGDTSAAVRAAGITAVAAIADDWIARADLHSVEQNEAIQRRNQCIATIESYLKIPLPPDVPHSSAEVGFSDMADAEHSPEWVEERAVRVLIYKTIGDHLYSIGTSEEHQLPRSGIYWGNRPFSFSNAYLPDADLSFVIFDNWVDFRNSHFSGNRAEFYRTHFNEGVTFAGSRFESAMEFRHTYFGGWDNFSNTYFGGNANFEGSTFANTVFFSGAAFDRDAVFNDAKIGGVADFSNVGFAGETSFLSTRFEGEATFAWTTFVDGSLTCQAKYDGDFDWYFYSHSCVTDFSWAKFSDQNVVDGLIAATKDDHLSHLPGHSEIIVGLSGDHFEETCKLINNTDVPISLSEAELVCRPSE